MRALAKTAVALGFIGAMAIGTTATVQAQGFYFGFGGGYPHYDNDYYRPYYHHYYRPYYSHYYRPYYRHYYYRHYPRYYGYY